jgi:DNA polymerase elongation subunit (family B)
LYQAIHYEKRKNKIHLWDDKKGHLIIPFKKYAYVKNQGGLHYTLDGDKVKKVYEWDNDDPNLFESDVPILTRFLVDQYTDSDELSKGVRTLFFDIEVEVVDGFPDVMKANEKITSIAFYDEMLEKYYCYTLDEKRTIQNYEKGDEIVELFTSEYELLTKFYQKYAEIQPHILSGWNSEFFDIPYLYNRSVNVLGKSVADMLSPIRDVYYNEYKKKHNIAGVSSLDYLQLYRQFTYTQQSSYRLDYIGEIEVGMKKVDYEGTLNDLYEKDLQTFIDYNIRDVRILVELDKKLDFINIARGIAHLGHVPYEDVNMSSRWLEGAILVYLKKIGVVAPNKPPRPKKLEDDKFAGAYVQPPQKGKHDWVYDLDITSMYPSVIRSVNISPETKVGRVDGWDAEEHLKKGLVKTYTLYNRDGRKIDTISNTDLTEYLENTGLSIASNGVMYRTDKQGLIPALLEKWFNERVEMRKLVKKYHDEGNKELESYFDRRQHIQKIVLNSLYGVLGLPVFRFYDLDNAEATTLTGQALIKFSKKITNHFYNRELDDNDDYVIYIDTDSIFASAVPLVQKRFPNQKLSDTMMTQRIMEICSEVQDYLNQSYNFFAKKFLNVDKDKHVFDIKQEVVAKTGLFITKKRYGLRIINDAGRKCDKTHVKGLDTIRSNFAVAMKELLQNVLDDILANVPKAQIDERISVFKRNMSLLHYDVMANPIGVKGIGKYEVKEDDTPFSTYKKGAPVHVKAAINYNSLLQHWFEGRKYEKIGNGSKIKWVYLKENTFGFDTIGYKGYEDPPQILEFIKTHIDHSRMFEQAMSKKIGMFYDAMNWEAVVDKQQSIERFF